ncbi:hypothetical protein AVEN_257630-1 [Araneus ventricosus]|uniref:Uncharacterized protein n=1 Tax=Araneus ventricosus TaxID=182803 RepID=A0A4Y2E6R4_ARAVE|nr:hypothetical protein AVEN_257630-1 [Araneus ventricosus]
MAGGTDDRITDSPKETGKIANTPVLNEELSKKGIATILEIVDKTDSLNGNQKKKVRKELNNLLGIITSQAMSISHLNGKIYIIKEELENKRRDLVAEQEQSRVIKDVRTYDDILEEPKTSRIPTEMIKEIHSVTIFPLKEDTPNDAKTKVQKEINPTKFKLSIKDVKKLKKGGLVIHCDTERDVDILKREFETNESLKKDYAFKQLARLNSKIILYGIEEHLTNEEVVANLKAQNDDSEKSTITLDFIMNTKKGTNVIISTDPKPFRRFRNGARVCPTGARSPRQRGTSVMKFVSNFRQIIIYQLQLNTSYKNFPRRGGPGPPQPPPLWRHP